ncbi:hypothetical protein Cob_v002470 [Colletotrichum orbiculare MAFF 240422]|uniref:Uncharacterized protein n=1 Tax=Colletotrichum orbiculare (strain 104-T / ATCC 96160 / CBS 514.97 / LARS 414 / MAFF 240422) TaxID=1213857 RepID=A0A484G376_COLOR|nr:hypothetical protein Cob_v002470 [Colletotrichum orbiculare MAFF 240422]
MAVSMCTWHPPGAVQYISRDKHTPCCSPPLAAKMWMNPSWASTLGECIETLAKIKTCLDELSRPVCVTTVLASRALPAAKYLEAG